MQSATGPGAAPGTGPEPALAPPDVAPDAEVLARALAAVVAARAADARMLKLRDEGVLGGYVPRAAGSLARALVASALGGADWLFTDGAELASSAALARGVTVANLFHHARGDVDDPTHGHPEPGHLALRRARVVPAGSSNGAHLTHAAGLAWAAKMRREPVVACAYLTPALFDVAEIHHGVNFAGVFRAPALFVGFSTQAIDVVDRGHAYGVATGACDAGDLAGLLAAARGAVARARGGEGPVLLDVRVDPAVDEEAAIVRLAALARQAGRAVDVAAIARAAEVEVDAAAASVTQSRLPARGTLFADVYAEEPWHLREQRDGGAGTPGARGT